MAITAKNFSGRESAGAERAKEPAGRHRRAVCPLARGCIGLGQVIRLSRAGQENGLIRNRKACALVTGWKHEQSAVDLVLYRGCLFLSGHQHMGD